MKSCLSLCVALVALVLAPGAAQAAAPKPIYLSLGDSLAAGVQPGQRDGEKTIDNTRQGYPRQLARLAGGLKDVEYGCGGATTESFIRGSKPCGPVRDPGYRNKSPKTSQLAAAERLLRRNRARVAFVTIDIGANDIVSCAQGGQIDFPCVDKGIAAIKKNAGTIARRLRRAAGKKVPMAVMTLYDPFLQQWFNGDSGKSVAEASVDIARTQVNAELIKAFKPRGFQIAEVAKAFDTYVPFERTTRYRGQAGVPVAVARICQLTWMCTAAPRGPDIHANTAGYALIAKTFRKVLGRAAR